MTVESEVSYLRTQLHSHIVKIQSVLVPLELQLISNLERAVRDIHVDLVNRIGRNHHEITARLERLEWHVVHGIPQNARVELAQGESSLQVPPELENIFSRETIGYRRVSETNSFSLGSWTGAFVAHMDESTTRFHPGGFLGNQTPSERQYVNLIKCVWILTKVKTGGEYLCEQPDSLWRTYIHGLETKLQTEIDRFSVRCPEAERLCKPALSDIMRLDGECFRLWLDEESKSVQKSPPEEDLMDMLLDFSLPDDDRRVEHRLKVLRSSAEGIRIVDSVTTISRSRTEKVIREYDINLGRVQLIPLYAAPTSSADALNLKFRDGIGASKDVPMSFKKLKDLAKFQHALTGYYIALDKRDVQAECFYHQHRSGGSRVLARGRLQIWVPKRLEKAPPRRDSEKPTATASNTSTAAPCGTQTSKGSIGIETLSQTAAFSAAGSALPALGRASTFTTSSGMGFLHSRPKRPMLVLCIEDLRKGDTDENRQYSFLAIKIDHHTFINRQSCDCRKEEKQCLDSSIEHRSGTLEASRYSMSTDLDLWSVAALGQWQQSDPGNHKVEQSLKWVKITSKTPKDRTELAGTVCGCKGSDLNASDDCNRNHRGTFGAVRTSYAQKLAEYNNRLNLPHVVH